MLTLTETLKSDSLIKDLYSFKNILFNLKIQSFVDRKIDAKLMDRQENGNKIY